MLNDTFVLEQATLMARSLQESLPGDLRHQVQRAWVLLTAREPEPAELGRSLAFLAEQAESLRAFHAAQPHPKPEAAALPADPQAEALASLCQVLLSSTRFLYVD